MIWAFQARGVKSSWESDWEQLPQPWFSGSLCVFCYILFSLMPSEKMSTGDSGAAWLTSCALVFHRPNQQLSFTEVSVTADLLSHFDLILASEGA